MKKSIVVRDQFEGQHCWPQAPKEVAFLRNPHRHIFHVTFEIEVNHDDRELEFFIFKNHLKSWFPRHFDLGSMSCEMLAISFIEQATKLYGDRKMICEISEDHENSAKVYK